MSGEPGAAADAADLPATTKPLKAPPVAAEGVQSDPSTAEAAGAADEIGAEAPTAACVATAAAAPKRAFLRRSAGRGAAGAQQRSAAPATSGRVDLLAFLRGDGPDAKGRRLDEILSWDFERLEKVHDYIQWIFPTDEPSKHHRAAPLLTAELRQQARGDAEILEGVRRSFRRFCDFLGLEACYEERGEQGGKVLLSVRKAPHYEERVPTCWHTRFSGNHNWLRISRVLLCLRLLGLDDEAVCFFACLESLHAEGLPCGASMSFWRKRVGQVVANADLVGGDAGIVSPG